MTSTMMDAVATVVAAGEVGKAVELVRGNEQELLARLTPVVRRQSIALDMNAVERIDAAGLAALITLYCDACKAGHSFSVMRPGRHVREMLALVGLDRILLAKDGEPRFTTRFEESAA